MPTSPRKADPASTHRSIAGLAKTALCAVVIGTMAVSGVAAQQVQRIAAVVNDEVISVYDISARIDLVIASSGLTNTNEQRQRLAPQVLRALIDERLQSQEAARLNIKVTRRDLDQAVAGIEASNGVPKGKFADFLAQRGVPYDAAMDQLEAELAWQKLLARRIVPTIEIGEEEIDAIIARINATREAPQYHVAEILLGNDDPGDRTQVRELAERLARQVRNGADFSAVARQFSQSATAATGGNIGWVLEGQLDDTVVRVLRTLSPGTVSDPVETPDGFVIYKLLDKRKGTAPAEDDREISLRQIVLRLDRDASDSDVSARISEARQTATAKNCADFVKHSKALGADQPPEPTRIRTGDLNEKLRKIVDELAVGEPSEPLRSPAGIQVVMVCERSDVAGPPRDEIRDALLRQRVDLRARRYLRDLRRAAFVDLRV